jgi:hypothetical protein
VNRSRKLKQADGNALTPIDPYHGTEICRMIFIIPDTINVSGQQKKNRWIGEYFFKHVD